MSEARCLAKIGGDSRKIERGSSIYDDQIARCNEVPVFFALQNCADESRIFSCPSRVTAIEGPTFQSEIFRRNCECLHARAR